MAQAIVYHCHDYVRLRSGRGKAGGAGWERVLTRQPGPAFSSVLPGIYYFVPLLSRTCDCAVYDGNDGASPLASAAVPERPIIDGSLVLGAGG